MRDKEREGEPRREGDPLSSEPSRESCSVLCVFFDHRFFSFCIIVVLYVIYIYIIYLSPHSSTQLDTYIHAYKRDIANH